MLRIAVVTGASSGMGKEFAVQLAARGIYDEIWMIARRADRLEHIADEINALYGLSAAKPVCLDISGKAGAGKFAAMLDSYNAELERSGTGLEIAMMVNNAGFGTYGPFEETDAGREMEMVELNCTALTGICSAALRYMNSGSVLINTASLASFLPLGNFAVYGATKAFVLSLSMALAAELKDRGIKVCALCPGPVSTEFADVASNGARKKVRHGLDAADVVAHCLRKAEKGRHMAIMAFKWKFKAAASRFIGRYAGARFTYKFCPRPHNP